MSKSCNHCKGPINTRAKKYCSTTCSNRSKVPPRGRTACYPKFSPEDSDLADKKWHASPRYAITSTRVRGRAVYAIAHVIVAERKYGRAKLPGEVCDHLNRDRMDCRRENLVFVTQQQNCQNKTYPGRFPRGVRLMPNGKWQAQCCVKYVKLHIGTFDTMEEAADAAAKKRRELGFHGEAAQ